MKSPVMRYLGGKFRNTEWVQSFFPEHEIYVEPFGGAASVLMTKPVSNREVYNDIDGDISNVFQVLRDHPNELKRLIELTPYSRDEWLASYDSTADKIESARRTIFRSFSSFGSGGATKGTSGFRSYSGLNSSYPPKKWNEYPGYVQDFSSRLKNVIIDNKNALDVIEDHDSEDTLFYLDPPYVCDTRVMSTGTKYYRHEMTNKQHKHLIELVKSLKGYVVLSGYDHKIYNSLIDHGWEKHQKNSRAQAFRGTALRTESIWINPKTISKKQQIDLIF